MVSFSFWLHFGLTGSRAGQRGMRVPPFVSLPLSTSCSRQVGCKQHQRVAWWRELSRPVLVPSAFHVSAVQCMIHMLLVRSIFRTASSAPMA